MFATNLHSKKKKDIKRNHASRQGSKRSAGRLEKPYPRETNWVTHHTTGSHTVQLIDTACNDFPHTLEQTRHHDKFLLGILGPKLAPVAGLLLAGPDVHLRARDEQEEGGAEALREEAHGDPGQDLEKVVRTRDEVEPEPARDASFRRARTAEVT